MEAGLLIYDDRKDSIELELKRFRFNGDLVMRVKSIDSMGNPIGLRERVFDPSRDRYNEYDPGYRISRDERNGKEKQVYSVFKNLSAFLRMNIKKHNLSQMVFFASAEDVNLIRRSGFRIGRMDRLDIQRELKPDLGMDISLDKASIIIGFQSEEERIRSMHFSYHVPEGFHDEMKPHNAIGDVSRIFLLHREMISYRDHLLEVTRSHMEKIRNYRDDKREIPVF